LADDHQHLVQTAQEQADNLAREQQLYRDRLAARQADNSITPEQLAADNSYVDTITLDSQDAAAAAGFGEGLQVGWQNVLNAPGKLVGGVGSNLGQVLGGVLKNIPWWAWLVAAGALFVWMGGLTLLRGQLGRFAR